MILILSELPATLKGPDDDGYHGQVPARMRFLAPDAADSLLTFERDFQLVYTDVFRSAAESLAAHNRKHGVQPPGRSGHGFGLSFDVDLDCSLGRLGLTYPKLRERLAAFGWHSHRRDGNGLLSEAWHFNFLGPDAAHYLALADTDNPGTWEYPVDQRIQERYGSQFAMSPNDVAATLYRLGLPSVEAFQQAWGLPADGIAGPVTQRTLAYVTAERRIVPVGNAEAVG